MDREILRPSSTVRASLSPDGLVVLDVGGGVLLASNPVGARIWQLLAGGHTPHDICRMLADEYDVVPEQARRDVAEFVDALVTRRLMVREATP